MTENSTSPHSNGLGGRKYEPWEEQTIHRLALFLRARDSSLNFYGEPRPRPRDYIFLYVKAAGVVFETAKALCGYKLPKYMQEKNIEDWLNIISGFPVASCADRTEIYQRFDRESELPNANGDVFPTTMDTVLTLTAGIEDGLAHVADRPPTDSPETKLEDPC